METRGRASVEPDANMPSSEMEPHRDTFQYDDEEERILMQMANENEEAPPSPGLEAAMEKSQRPSKPIEQSHPTALFMERPQSSGIDTAGFFFAKPTTVRSFSVKSTKSSIKQHPTLETAGTEPGASSSIEKKWDTPQE